jgi:two-component system, NarL family, sensor histidine kinase UhpB
MVGRNGRSSSKFPFGALIAVLVVQLAYWLVVNPVLLVPNPTPDKLAVTNVAAAQVLSPDLAALEKASFKPIKLPWDDCCDAGYRAVKAEFFLPSVPHDGLAIVPMVGSDNFRMFINGSLLFGDGDMELPTISYHGTIRATFRIPSAMLRQGRNQVLFILVRDAGTPYFSIKAPVIGDYATIKRAFSLRQFSLTSYLTMSQGIGFAAALLALILWLRSDRNPSAFWMALLCAAWAMRIMHHRATYSPIHGELRIVLLYAYVNMVPVALLNFANHWTQRPFRWIPRISVVGYGVIMAIVATIVGFGLFDKIDTADRFSMGFGLMMAFTTVGLFLNHYLRRAEKRHWEAAVFILCATLIGYDAITSLFDMSYGDHVKRALPVLLLGFIAPFFAGNVRLFRSMGEFNQLLQGQLADRTAELEAAHQRETAVVRAAAQLNERQRIMRDMHDGLGSQLMSMLLAARRGEAKPPAVADGLQSVIDEMRLMIDSMDSVGESLGSAFAIFKERVQSRVEAAGIAFTWLDNTHGQLPEYGPRDVLQVFRIMQEAVTNALKHSGGDAVSVVISPSSDPDFALSVAISDTGRGLGKANPRGKGQESMAARAASVGASLETISTGKGVTVRLDLPQSHMP